MTADKHTEDELDRALEDPALARAVQRPACRGQPPGTSREPRSWVCCSRPVRPRPHDVERVRGATVGLVVVGVVAGGVGAAAAAGHLPHPLRSVSDAGERRAPRPVIGRGRADLADRHPAAVHRERRPHPRAHHPRVRRGRGHRRCEQLRRGQPVRARRATGIAGVHRHLRRRRPRRGRGRRVRFARRGRRHRRHREHADRRRRRRDDASSGDSDSGSSGGGGSDADDDPDDGGDSSSGDGTDGTDLDD